MLYWAYFSIILTIQTLWVPRESGEPVTGISFQFKNREISLQHPMRSHLASRYLLPQKANDATLDTLCSRFDRSLNYVEIIRQDHARQPSLGIALGFEFDEEAEEYPYTPAKAVLQLKNFAWGGVEFSTQDTFNFTGVSNNVSDDLEIEVEGFRNDTIWGRFSGLLLSGGGTMTTIEKGRFRVRVYVVDHP
ncbi:MAG: hypothetical protein IT269_07365 [Saprospiraceae bacterium]|nr:hypothetical protein [Saprospiraceae bacterium]